MRVITVATHSKGYFPILQESCRTNQLQLDVLGFGKKWQGFQWRFQLMREYLQKLPRDEVVVFVDGYDVFAVADERTIMERFLEFRSPIVVSTEVRESWVSQKMYERVFGKSCNGWNLNAGLYMGYCWALLKMYDSICDSFDCSDLTLDDQKMFMTFCRTANHFYNEHVKIDKQSKLFLNVSPKYLAIPTVEIDDYELFTRDGDRRIVVTETMLEPCFIHGPGNAKLEPILQMYGYDVPVDASRDHEYYPNAIKTYCKYFWPELLLLLITIAVIILLGCQSRKS